MNAVLKQPLQEQEHLLSVLEINTVRKMIQSESGITIGGSNQQLIIQRISHRLKALLTPDFSCWIEVPASGRPAEFRVFLNTITANLNSFFRERCHFDYLTKKVAPEIEAKVKSTGKKLRVRSVGCSTGQQPYSIAMTHCESMSDIDQWDTRILCNYLDTEVLAKINNGVYAQHEIDHLSADLFSNWFVPEISGRERIFLAKPEPKKLLLFNQLNLVAQRPMKGLFDVIYYRNVIICSDIPAQIKLMKRFFEYIASRGYLILGHSDSLHGA